MMMRGWELFCISAFESLFNICVDLWAINFHLDDAVLYNFRRAFNYFTYVGLLYSIASGLYSNVIRIMTAFVCTLLIMPRQDIVVLPSLFKSADSG